MAEIISTGGNEETPKTLSGSGVDFAVAAGTIGAARRLPITATRIASTLSAPQRIKAAQFAVRKIVPKIPYVRAMPGTAATLIDQQFIRDAKRFTYATAIEYQKGVRTKRISLAVRAPLYKPSAYPLTGAPRKLFGSGRKAIVSISPTSGLPKIQAVRKPPLFGVRSEKIKNLDRLAQMAGRDLFGPPTGKGTASRMVARAALGATGASLLGTFPLAQLSDRRSQARALTEQLAQRILNQIKGRAPVDTGRLRNTLTVNVVYTTSGLIGSSGVDFQGGGFKAWLVVGANVRGNPDTFARIEITSPTEYGYYVEFGTIHMGAQPFVRPVLRQQHTASADNVQVGTQVGVARAPSGTRFRTSTEVDGGRVRVGLAPVAA